MIGEGPGFEKTDEEAPLQIGGSEEEKKEEEKKELSPLRLQASIIAKQKAAKGAMFKSDQ